jgi:hypothetical protein
VKIEDRTPVREERESYAKDAKGHPKNPIGVEEIDAVEDTVIGDTQHLFKRFSLARNRPIASRLPCLTALT